MNETEVVEPTEQESGAGAIISALSGGNNIAAGNAFDATMQAKMGDALDAKRQEVASDLVKKRTNNETHYRTFRES